MAMTTVTDANFDSLVNENEFVLLDFWADWCGPCKIFKRVIEAVAPQFPEFLFGSINIDEEEVLTKEFEIRSVPSLMILRQQVVVFAQSGTLTAEPLTDLLQQARDLDVAKLDALKEGE